MRALSAGWAVTLVACGASSAAPPDPGTRDVAKPAPAPAPTAATPVSSVILVPAMGPVPAGRDGVIAQNERVARVTRVRMRGPDVSAGEHADPLVTKGFARAVDPNGRGTPMDFPGCQARGVIEMEDRGVTLITVAFCPDEAVMLFPGIGARRLSREEIKRLAQFAVEPTESRCWSDCLTSGLCTPRAGRCVATRDVDCAKSSFCKLAGSCSVVGEQCGAGPSAGCADSINCKTFGMCGKGPKGCTATEDRHCRDSHACQAEGRCGLGGSGGCEVGETQHCAQSLICRSYGLCALGKTPSGRPACVATARGCAASETCRRDKVCRAQPNTAQASLKLSAFDYTTDLTPAVICR